MKSLVINPMVILLQFCKNENNTNLYMDKVFICEGKKHIDANCPEALSQLYKSIEKHITDSEYCVNIQNIYQKLFLYSCIKNSKDCISFLMNLYNTKFDTVSKIALRQSFYYGKYLIKNKPIRAWYDSHIIAQIKVIS